MTDQSPISESMKFRYYVVAFSGTLMAGLAVGAYWLVGRNAILFSNSDTERIRLLMAMLFVIGILTAIAWGFAMLALHLRHALQQRRDRLKDVP